MSGCHAVTVDCWMSCHESDMQHQYYINNHFIVTKFIIKLIITHIELIQVALSL